MKPPLIRSWRQRSFVPCRQLCAGLLSRNSAIPQDALIRAVLGGLPFERDFWHGLIGECLVHGAMDIPRLNTAPEALCCLLAPEHRSQPDIPRSHYAPIQQAHWGTRDLQFGGGYYRPEHAGLNDKEDVERLANYLAAVNPAAWEPRDLEPLDDCPDDEQRGEELAYVRDWWPSLVELYQEAKDRRWIVVCEKV